MATVVIMPRQGQSVESCVITSWAKKVGDPVHTGETLFSYETDKAAFDEEAKVDGTLLAVFYQEQDDVPCLSEVAVISPLSVLMQMCRPLRRKRRRQLLPRWQPRPWPYNSLLPQRLPVYPLGLEWPRSGSMWI